VSQPKNDGVVEELQRELAACREQNSVLASNLKKAQGDVERLTAELAEEKSKASKLEKLDDILSILQKQGTSRVIISDSPTLSAVEDDAPRYIPSQIKSEASVEGSTEVVEEVQSEDSSVSKASQALRKARRNS
jgi:multidrug resistance efflux pump